MASGKCAFLDLATDIHLDWIEHRNRRPNQKLKPEVRHVLRPGAMLNGPTRGVKDYRFYCKTDIFRSFRLILAKHTKKSSQIWYFKNKHTS